MELEVVNLTDKLFVAIRNSSMDCVREYYNKASNISEHTLSMLPDNIQSNFNRIFRLAYKYMTMERDA